MAKPPERELLAHVLSSMRKIVERVGRRNAAELAADEVLLDAVLKQIENLGEAARLLPDDFKAAHPDIPWRVMQAMRNRLSHVYWAVDPRTVHAVAVVDLPPLIVRVEAILKTLGDPRKTRP